MGNSHFFEDNMDNKSNSNFECENLIVNQEIIENREEEKEEESNELNPDEILEKSIDLNLHNDVFLNEGEIYMCNECKDNKKTIMELNDKLDILEEEIDILYENNEYELSNYNRVFYEYENLILQLKKELKEKQFMIDYQKEINMELKINYKILKLRLKEKSKYKKFMELNFDNKITRRYSI